MTGRLSPDVKARRKALRAKAIALKELMEIGDLTYEEYTQEMAKLQIERRKLKNANVIDVEVVSVEDVGSSGKPVDDSVVTKQVPNGTTKDGDPRYRTSMVRWRPPQYSAEWWEQTRPEVQEKRCRAKNTKGEQCQRISVAGARVCYMHGGAAPHVKRAAMARLENAADRMARNLLGLADEAESENVRLSATNSALDRVGIKSATEVVLSAGQQTGFDEIMEDLQFGTMTRAESRAARGLDPDTAQPLSGNDFGAFNLADYQSNCTPQPATGEPNYVGTEQQSDSFSHNDSGIQFDKTHYSGPASTQSDADPIPRPSRRANADRPRERRCGPTVTGDAALALAAEANRICGALRELE